MWTRFALLLLLAAWIGAVALFAAGVAPAAFRVLPTRSLAGALVGELLPVLFIAGLVLGAAAVVAALGERPALRLRWLRLLGGALLVGGCFAGQVVIGPRIDRIRTAAGPSLETLPPGDARRAAFGRLHGLSVAALGLALIGAAAAGASLLLTLTPEDVG